MDRIVYTRPDGGVSVVHPVINTHGEEDDITEDKALTRALAQLPTDAIAPAVVEESTIPSDRSFRDAWRYDGRGITVDMAKAREITAARLRRERAPLLAALDVAYMRADEAGDAVEKLSIATEKQRLRDITKQVGGAANLDGLKNLSAA